MASFTIYYLYGFFTAIFLHQCILQNGEIIGDFHLKSLLFDNTDLYYGLTVWQDARDQILVLILGT